MVYRSGCWRTCDCKWIANVFLFYSQDGLKTSWQTVDMEQNYVTLTLCIWMAVSLCCTQLSHCYAEFELSVISILSAISAASITCVCFPGYLIRCFSREFTPSVPLHLWQAVCTLCEQFSKHICGYLQLADIVLCCNSVLYCILMPVFSQPMLGRFIFHWDQCLRLQSQSTV